MNVKSVLRNSRVLPAIAFVASLSSEASALPTAMGDALSADTLRRARAALSGHPAESKVSLLPEAPIGGKASDTVHVLPLQARTRLALTRLATPQCGALETAAADVNRAINALAVLAESVLAQANRIGELLDAHAKFVLEHSADLALADEGSAKIITNEAVVAQLQAELLVQTNPILIAFYAAEIAAAQRAVEAARNDPRYIAAFAVKAQADALMDAALKEHEAWDATFAAKLASADATLEAARALYDDLSTLEVAAADARMPVWDADVLSLVQTTGGVRSGIRFVPAALEELAWSIQDAEMPRMAPIEIEISGEFQQRLNGGSRLETLPGLTERAPTRRMQPLSAADYASAVTSFAEGVLGRVWSRETKALKSSAPLIRASVPMGSYCGSLKRIDFVPAAVTGARTRAALRTQNYQFVKRPRAAVEAYLGIVDYRVKVHGPTTSATCSLDLAQYAAASNGKPVNVGFLWRRYDGWDPLLLHRLRRLGVRCTVKDLEAVRALGLPGILRDAASLTVADVSALLGQVKDAVATRTVPKLTLPPSRIPSGDVRRAGQAEICIGNVCQLPAIDTTLVQSICRALDPRGQCSAARLAGQVRWAPLYWTPGQIRSQLDFEIPKL